MLCSGCLAVSEAVQQSHGPELTSAQTPVTPSLHWQPGHHSSAPALPQLCAGTPQLLAQQGRHCPVPSSWHKQAVILLSTNAFNSLGALNTVWSPTALLGGALTASLKASPFPFLSFICSSASGHQWDTLEKAWKPP